MHIPRLTILVFALLLISCQTLGSDLGSTNIPNQLATTANPDGQTVASQVSTSNPTPTLRVEPTQDSVPPTPNFPASQVMQGLLLSDDKSSGCALPCWNGLLIGESTGNEVENVFAQTLNSEVGYDFSSISQTNDPLLTQLLQIDGFSAIGQGWNIESSTTDALGSYYFYAMIGQDDDRLAGLAEVMKSHGVYAVPGLQEVVKRLGQPEWIYGGSEHLVSVFQVVMFYRGGIKVDITFSKHAQDNLTSLVCFNNQPTTISFFITNSYVNLDTNALSPIQKAFGAPRDPAPYAIEDLQMSIDEFSEFINTPNPCITVPR